MKEKTVVQRVDRMFRDRGLRVQREVPLAAKRIDLVAFNPRSAEITAVEAKVRDWRAGLRQAMIYRICADRVYVAVDERFADRMDFGALRPYGIGAIAVNGTAQVVLRAGQSTIVHSGLLRKIRESFANREELEGDSRIGNA